MKNFLCFLRKKIFSESFLLLTFGSLAFFMANISDGFFYQKIVNFKISLPFKKNCGITISHVINEGLMVFFFLLIGLEIKYELIKGELKILSRAMLPVVAAVGGMIVPVFIYKLVTYRNPDLHVGWAIPIATDIAFAVGILSIFKENPKFRNLRLFLTTLAIVDDLGAVIVIFLFYNNGFNVNYVIPLFFTIGILVLMNFCRIKNYILYLLVGIILWNFMCIFKIHPTLSGIVVGFIIPIDSYDQKKFSIRLFLDKLLRPSVSYCILPLFSFINAGVNLTKFNEFSLLDFFNNSFSLLPIGIFLGLFVGKPIGIISFVKICLKLKFIKLLEGISFRDIQSISILCGIGFTMSIFITNLAFDSNVHQELSDLSKIGIIFSSLISIILGFFTLKRSISD